MNEELDVIIDFYNTDFDGVCKAKIGCREKILSKDKLVNQIIMHKKKQIVRVKERNQIFKHSDDSFINVYKFIIIFPNKSKIIIKNVSETDVYFDELNAISLFDDYIYLTEDGYYPHFTKDEIKTKKIKIKRYYNI